MARKEIGSIFDRNNRNAMNDNFKELYEGIETASTWKEKSDAVLNEANQVNKKNIDVQQQINSLILESGTSDAEVIQARGGYSVLNERLNETDVQLENAEEYNKALRDASSANARTPLNIPVYYSDQAVHPSVVWDSTKKYGHEWIMAFTPYYMMNDSYENPSIVVSNNGLDWDIPTGLTNPIVSPDNTSVSHYSDVDLFDNGTELELWYRETHKANKTSRLWRMKSTDCKVWSTPELLFDYGTGGNGYGAPSVIMLNGVYNLYYRSHMSLGVEGYILRTSTDGSTFGTSKEINFDFGMWEGHVSWHVEFNYFDGKYYALNYAVDYANQGNSNYDGKLFLFESTDGINFTNCRLILAKSDDGFDSAHMYKASMVKWGSQYWVYYSAFDKYRRNKIGLSIARNGLDSFTGYSPEFTGKTYNVNVIEPDTLLTIKKPVKILNSGISGVQLNATKTDTLSIIGDNGVKGGFLETPGIFLNTPKNTSIESNKTEGALFQSSTSKNLSIVSGGAVGEIRRSINFNIIINNGEPSITFRSGSDFVESVTTAFYGMDINLKNTATNYNFPTYIMKSTNGLGLKTSTKTVGFDFIRTSTSTKLGIGLMDVVGGTEIPLSTIVSGSVNITIFI